MGPPDGISVLLKETPELPPQPLEGTQREDISVSQEGASLESHYAIPLVLDPGPTL